MANIFTCLACPCNRTSKNCWKINLCPRKGYTPTNMNSFTSTIITDDGTQIRTKGTKEKIKNIIKEYKDRKRVTIKMTRKGILV